AVVLALQSHAEPVVAPAPDAPQDGDRLVHVADDEVGPAVVVQVPEPDPARRVGRREVAPDPPAGVAELPALVEQEDRVLLAARVLARRVADGMAVGDEKVLPPVEVRVDEGGSPPDVLLADR